MGLMHNCIAGRGPMEGLSRLAAVRHRVARGVRRGAAAGVAGVLLALPGGAPAAAGSGEHVFQSPTGNIHCTLQEYTTPPEVRCDLVEAVVSFKMRPADCGLDFGQAFYLQQGGGAAPVCHGDTIITRGAAVLDYGQRLQVEGITCTSERSGMTCRNREGRGFTLARARQQVY